MDVSKFLEDIEKVCKAHDMSICHEDNHGGFLICKYNEDYMDWLKEAIWEDPAIEKEFWGKFFNEEGD